MELLQRIQRRAAKITKGLENLSCEVKLKELTFFSLGKRRLHGDLIVTFQYLKEAYKHEGKQLFTRIDIPIKDVGNGFKLKGDID